VSDGRGTFENYVPGQACGDPFIRIIGDAIYDGAEIASGSMPFSVAVWVSV
jgi:hypothetical protein